MSVRLAPAVVDSLLLGPESRRRQLQDFPVLGDVWSKFADEPGEILDLLIVPTRERPTGEVVSLIAGEHGGDADKGCCVAYLQDLVVASFGLNHLYRVLIPATRWWDQIQDSFENPLKEEDLARWIRRELADTLGGKLWKSVLEAEREGAAELSVVEQEKAEAEHKEFESLKTSLRQAAKLGLVLGVFLSAAESEPEEAGLEESGPDGKSKPLPDLATAVRKLTSDRIVARGAEALMAVIERYDAFNAESEADWNGVIFQVTLNRPAEAALAESVPAIKADAARHLFSISCRDIGWAVLDSGIDYSHPAFAEHDSKMKLKRPHRIKAAYDFRRIRAILGVRAEAVDALADEILVQSRLELGPIKDLLVAVAKDRVEREPLDWRKIQQLIELDIFGEPPKGDQPKGVDPKAEIPTHPHGTHVAGIIGADWQEEGMVGICPDIFLFDLRVLGSSLGDSEFAVTAALQFVRFLNEQSGARIHGVNMSIAIRHNVRNYACGRTPVCLEAEALVANGVVVVAAAGNRGYQVYQLADSTTFESYAASSITDPGNAAGVITVGATHRQWPHTYGVSFFSSRGPTGDGRLKPDLLAPGEKIVSCVPGGRQDQMDGTSMAAPHVSGAAALLMGRHKEFKGQPARVKQILCETATDLKRERSFQGHGMVDVLRAIQSI
ncbi:MAG TPA: S8 family serine peptidase [Allosphingosinicella sp.]|nr:S8 family serine peptidase [Allosphingosinicella sp.]